MKAVDEGLVNCFRLFFIQAASLFTALCQWGGLPRIRESKETHSMLILYEQLGECIITQVTPEKRRKESMMSESAHDVTIKS